MWSKDWLRQKESIILLSIILIGAMIRGLPPLMLSFPGDSDPYLYGAAANNVLLAKSFSYDIPFPGYKLHQESPFFVFLLVFLKTFTGFSMNNILRVLPLILAVFNILGAYLLANALLGKKELAILTAFFMAFNPYHIYRTDIAIPEALAIPLYYFSFYFMLKGNYLSGAITGIFILLTDPLIAGQYVVGLMVLLFLRSGRHLLLLPAIVLPFFLYGIWAPDNLISIIRGLHLSYGGISHLKNFSGFYIMAVPLVIPLIILCRKVLRTYENWPFIYFNFIIFLFLSFFTIVRTGVQPFRHLICFIFFMGLLLSIALEKSKWLAMVSVITVLGSYFILIPSTLYPVLLTGDVLEASHFIEANTSTSDLLASSSAAYGVLPGRSIIYENDPCGSKEIDYVVQDQNSAYPPQRYFGEPLEINDTSCLSLVYREGNVSIFRVNH